MKPEASALCFLPHCSLRHCSLMLSNCEPVTGSLASYFILSLIILLLFTFVSIQLHLRGTVVIAKTCPPGNLLLPGSESLTCLTYSFSSGILKAVQNCIETRHRRLFSRFVVSITRLGYRIELLFLLTTSRPVPGSESLTCLRSFSSVS